MPAFRRARVVPVAIVLAVSAAVLTTVVTARRSDAYPPSRDLIFAFNRFRMSIPLDEHISYFQFADGNGPDDEPGPDGTADGRGAFQYYTGSRDQGAIYSQLIPGAVFGGDGAVIHSGGIWGDIGAAWSAAGYENSYYGYPVGLERYPYADEIAKGCKADRVHEFEKVVFPDRVNGIRYSIACWSEATGRVKWFARMRGQGW